MRGSGACARGIRFQSRRCVIGSAAEMSEEEKKKRSDLIVDNSGTREELEKQLKSLLFSDPF